MITLREVYGGVRADPAFDPFRKRGRTLVPGRGATPARIFLVGDAPSATDQTAGRSWSGPVGEALRSLIVDVAGIPLESCFLTNVSKYWTGQERRSLVPFETHKFTPHLRREWAAAGSPKVTVALGGVARQALLPEVANSLESFGRSYGSKWLMIHPAHALGNPSIRDTVEEHWERFGSWFREEVCGGRV